VLSREIYQKEGYLQQVFNMFDKDKAGSIDKFKCYSLMHGPTESPPTNLASIEQALAELDLNSEGGMDFDSFCGMMN